MPFLLPASRIIGVPVDAAGNLEQRGALQQHPVAPHRQGPQEPPREPVGRANGGDRGQGQVALAPSAEAAGRVAAGAAAPPVGARGAAGVARVCVLAAADAGDNPPAVAGRGCRCGSAAGKTRLVGRTLDFHIFSFALFFSIT